MVVVVLVVVVVVVVVSEGHAGAVSLLERFGVRGSHHHYYALTASLLPCAYLLRKTRAQSISKTVTETTTAIILRISHAPLLRS